MIWIIVGCFLILTATVYVHGLALLLSNSTSAKYFIKERKNRKYRVYVSHNKLSFIKIPLGFPEPFLGISDNRDYWDKKDAENYIQSKIDEVAKNKRKRNFIEYKKDIDNKL